MFLSTGYFKILPPPPLQPKTPGAGHGWSCFLVIYLNKRKFVKFEVVKRSLADFIALLVKDPLTQTDKHFAFVHTNYVVITTLGNKARCDALFSLSF